MKVAYFLGGLIRGGMESLVLDVLKNHSSVPFEMVCIYRKEGNYSEAFRQSGAEMIQLERKRHLMNYIVHLRKLFIQTKIDIVHAQTATNALLCSVALLGTGIKLVTTIHGFSFANARSWRQRIVFAMSKKVIFVSEFQKQEYCKRLNFLNKDKKYQVVYNGIDSCKFDTKYEKPIFLQKGCLNLAMVGSFSTARSQEIIIQALKVLLQENKIDNVMFYFVGGPFKGDEQRMINSQALTKKLGLDHIIKFVGARDDIPAILQHIDGYVYSSAADTFGIAVVEAMMAGAPVVVNDFDVMKEVTKNGEWANLYRTNDIHDCAEKINELITKNTEYKAKAKEISSLSKTEYSIAKHIQNLNYIYNQI